MESSEKEQFKSISSLYEAFKAPFPDEAYSVDSSRGFNLTSLKAQYIVERLNETIGFDNWRLDGKPEQQDDGSVLFQGHLVLFLGDYGKLSDGSPKVHTIPTVGYSTKKKLLGDAYKGARTDALSKAGSYIGIGNEMFKGNISSEKGQKNARSPAKGAKQTTNKTETKKPASFQGKKPKTEVKKDF